MIYRVLDNGDFYRTDRGELERELTRGAHSESEDDFSKMSVSDLRSFCGNYAGDPAIDSFCFSKAEAVEISKTLMKGDDE